MQELEIVKIPCPTCGQEHAPHIGCGEAEITRLKEVINAQDGANSALVERIGVLILERDAAREMALRTVAACAAIRQQYGKVNNVASRAKVGTANQIQEFMEGRREEVV